MMTEQPGLMKKKRTQTSARGKDRKWTCRDCLFWYRCRLGQIDCEIKS